MSKCLDCGITLSNSFEKKDKRCGNCQADFIRKQAKKAFQSAIDYINTLDDDDFEQDEKLSNLYEELGSYYTR
jgi:hypothetical protein